MKKKKYTRLSEKERIQIESYLLVHKTVTEISNLLNRPKSTISGEIKRTRSLPGKWYSADQAHWHAVFRNCVKRIDFDGSNDFICTGISEFILNDYWINSKLDIVNKQSHYDAYYKFWFVQLDNDAKLETYSAWGYSEGIDYFFSDFDYKNKAQTVLCHVNPVILDSTTTKIVYLGYAWEIQDIYIQNGKILSSINHNIKRNDVEIMHTDWQRILPIIFFKGKSTQPNVNVESFNNLEYLSIEDLINKIKQ